MDDDPVLAMLQFDRLEWQHARAASGLGWELQGWVGDLENRVWLRSEGVRRNGATSHGDVELLWGRPSGPWWDALAGVRHDLGHGPRRDWLAFGVQGLAPYKFEVAATAYLGTGGRFAARAEVEYELLLTNRLVLQPRLEADLYGKDDPERGTGKGLSDAALGLRLRYELHRQFAPYVGYEWSRTFGRTADLAGAAGQERSDHMWVAGVRFWF
jgi:copper resistance protein B